MHQPGNSRGLCQPAPPVSMRDRQPVNRIAGGVLSTRYRLVGGMCSRRWDPVLSEAWLSCES